MNDTVIAVNENESEIAKVYFNNVRNEGGKVSATLTAVNKKEQKIETEIKSVEIDVKQFLVPAGLKALGLTSPEVQTTGSDEELLAELDAVNAKLKAANDKIAELEAAE